MEIRTYSAARHDRFTGFPAAPVWNDSAYYESRKFTGIGWLADDPGGRQFALVSPEHLIFARHHTIGGGLVRFLNASGQIVERTAAGYLGVLNSAGQETDLCIIGLTAPLTAADGVSFFPYLNLANEAAYTGRELVIFGQSARAGGGTVNGFEDSGTNAGINPTRLMRFRYQKLFGGQDDARLVNGDSGSPTFSMVGGVPAVLGIHSTAAENAAYYTGYDSFIPNYITQLNTVMEPYGYRMTPLTPPSVTLTAAAASMGTLRQAHAGSHRFDLQNTSANVAGNAKASLQFPSGLAPASVSGSGWITEQTGPETWSFRRANVAAGGTASLTATWTVLPVVSAIPVQVTRAADGYASNSSSFNLTVVPSFAVWAAGLPDAATGGDPDQDGVTNLLEYAFGGDPATASLSSAAGGLLLPVVSMEGGRAVARFPVRDDAAARGLTYAVEFSADLSTGSWTTTPPAGLSEDSSPFSPSVVGFQRRSISWDASGRLFCRVKVTLVTLAE